MADRYEWERDRENERERGENRGRSEFDRRREYGEREGRGRLRYSTEENRFGQQTNEGRYGEGRYGERDIEGRYGQPGYGYQRDEERYGRRDDQRRYGQPAYEDDYRQPVNEGRYGQGGFGLQGGFGQQGSFGGSGEWGERGDWGRQGSNAGRHEWSQRRYEGFGAGESYAGGPGSYSGGPGSFGGGMGGYGQTGRYTGRGPKGWHRSDERIQEDINQRLTDHPYIDASEIEVQVRNGEVTLTGSVEERNAKRMAEDVAEGVSGVGQVHNQLRVQTASSSSFSSAPANPSTSTPRK